MKELIGHLTRLAPEITVLGALTLLQITPIKINPWSWLAKMIRRILGTENLREDLDHIEKRIDNLEIKFDEKISKLDVKGSLSEEVNVLTLRASIISDYTSLKNGVIFDQTAYDEIHRKNTLYRKLLKEANIENGYIDNIMRDVNEMMRNGGFTNEEIY